MCLLGSLALAGGLVAAAGASNVTSSGNSSDKPAAGVRVGVVQVGKDGRLVRTWQPVATNPTRVSKAGTGLKPNSEATSPATSPAVGSVTSSDSAMALMADSAKPPMTAPTSVPRAAETTGIGNGRASVDRLIEQASADYRVDPLLVRSVIHVESNFQTGAVSPKGAQGLMQLIPSTAKRFGVTDPFDAKQNIEGGVKYLRHLQDLFPSDLRLSLAAYNAGEGAVSKYGDVPPYRETQDYVEKVKRHYESARQGAPKATAAAGAAEPKPADVALEPRHVEQSIDAEGRLYLRTR